MIWINIGIFEILVELGFRVLVVDLLGYGKFNDVNIFYKCDDIFGYMINLFIVLDFYLLVMVFLLIGGEYVMLLLMVYFCIFCGFVVIVLFDM